MGPAGLCLARRIRTDRSLRRAEHRPDLFGRAGGRRACSALAWCADCFGRAKFAFSRVAMVLVLLYALGKYTPAFHLMYDVVPGVSLFRRPADATFVFGALLAIVAGYLVHRWLTDTRAAAAAVAARRGILDCRRAGRSFGRVWRCGSASCRTPHCRSCGASDLRRCAIACADAGAPACGASTARSRGGAGRVQRRRPWLEQCAERVDGLEAVAIRCAAPRHHRRNHHAAEDKARRRRGARPPRPRRADRHRLSLAEHRAHSRLRPSVRAQSAAADGFRARHRRARHGRRCRSAAVSAADVVLSLGAGKSVRRALHRHRRADREDRSFAQAGGSQSRSADQGRLRLRKPAGTAARHAGDGVAQGRFRRDDPQRRLAGRRSAPHGAARKRAGRRAGRRRAAAPPASCAIRTPTSRSKPTRPAADLSFSTTSGIRGGGRASTTSRRTSSKPTCCSAPSLCRPASTSCASRSTRSRAHSPS